MTKIVFLSTFLSVALATLLAPSRSLADENGLQVIAPRLFDSLDAGQVYELTLPAELQRSLTFNFMQDVSVQEVQAFTDELVLGGRYAKFFYPRPTVYRRHLETAFRKLLTLMKAHRVSAVNLVDLAGLAEKRIVELKANRKIGNCYFIESQEEPMLPMARWVCVSWAAQNAIDTLFARTVNVDDLNSQELSSLMADKFNLQELAELRALRVATEIFENATYLKMDRAGGFINNFRGELLGGFQLNCWNRGMTYNSFLEQLAARGLLRFHRPNGMVTKRPGIIDDWSQGGHVASGIRNIRTNELYVIETWYESGGQPAHIMTYNDWFALPVTYWRTLDFKDVVDLRR